MLRGITYTLLIVQHLQIAQHNSERKKQTNTQIYFQKEIHATTHKLTTENLPGA